jgi:hypothetical protein
MAGERRRRVAGGRRIGALVALAAGFVAVAGVVAYALFGSQALPDGPLPVAWDQQPCAHCQMHVGDPGFAVQLQLADGDVVYEHQVDAHATYFHHRHDDRWLPRSAVAFVWEATSPMGGGLAAVDPGTAGALDYGQALAREHGWAHAAHRAEMTASPGMGG